MRNEKKNDIVWICKKKNKKEKKWKPHILQHIYNYFFFLPTHETRWWQGSNTKFFAK